MELKEYIEIFDEIFNTDISSKFDIRNFPMLNMMFSNLAEYFYKSNNEQKKIAERLLKAEKTFLDSLTTNEAKNVDELFDIETESKAKLAERMLVFGYLLAYEELKEMKALK